MYVCVCVCVCVHAVSLSLLYVFKKNTDKLLVNFLLIFCCLTSFLKFGLYIYIYSMNSSLYKRLSVVGLDINIKIKNGNNCFLINKMSP